MTASTAPAANGKYRVEIHDKLASFLVYGDDEDHYEAICLLYFYFDVAIVSGMHGRNLLGALAEQLVTALPRDYGVRYLEGYVLLDVARACQIVCRRNGGQYAETKHYESQGRHFVWVSLQLGAADQATPVIAFGPTGR
jgi:hypothetical protein